MGDIEILQSEGFDAVRMVEQAYKMKKDAKTVSYTHLTLPTT